MQVKLLAVLVAALGANVALADAVTPATAAAAVTAGRAVYISGASALKASVKGAIAQSACNDAAVTTFAATDSDINAYACTIKPAGFGGMPAGQVAVFFHTVKDGSFKSIEGMSTDPAKQVSFVRADFGGCTGSASSYTKCNVTKARSQGGFSDVEAELWADYVQTNPIPGVLLSQVSKFKVDAGQSFGVAVSPSLYAALQAAQGLSASEQPSITHQQYATLVAKQNAGKIEQYENDGLGAWFNLGLMTTGEKVVICRRPATSGTQAASNAYFLGANCLKTGALEVAGAADSNAAFSVREYSSTGDVKLCLSELDSPTLGTKPSVAAAAGTLYRIGVVSAENATDPAKSETWKYVKVDGVAVDEDAGHRKATVEMRYDFAFEFALHTHKDTAVTPAVAKSTMEAIAVAMGDPVVTNLRGIFIKAGANGNFYSPDVTLPQNRVHQATRDNNACAPFQFKY